MTAHQLVAERVRATSRAAVAAEIGISELDLRDFMTGIAIAAMPATRLAGWLADQSASRQALTGLSRMDALPAGVAGGGGTPAKPRAALPPRRDNGWGFVRAASKRFVEQGDRETAAPSLHSVPLQTLQQYYADEFARVGSWVAIRASTGASITALRRFVATGKVQARVIRKLVRLYESRGGELSVELWRTIGLQALQEYYAAEFERVGSWDAIRRATGVSIPALRRFVATGRSRERVLRKLALLYDIVGPECFRLRSRCVHSLDEGQVTSRRVYRGGAYPGKPCESISLRNAGISAGRASRGRPACPGRCSRPSSLGARPGRGTFARSFTTFWLGTVSCPLLHPRAWNSV